MKQCQKCNFQNDALIDYCRQCGAHLDLWQGNGHPQNVQPTQFFQSETPTYFRADQFQSYHTNYHTNQNGFTSNYQQPAAAANSPRKIILLVASVLTFFILFSVVGAATAYKVFHKPVKPVEETYTVPARETEPVKTTEPVKESKTDKKTDTVKESNSSDDVKTVKNTNPTKNSSTTKNTRPVNNNTTDKAKYKNMWVDYDVRESGRLGMRIHVNFEVFNMKGVDSYLAVYFEKANGTPLKTGNKKFASKEGQVAVYRLLTPGYNDAVYDDLSVFMPYDELKLGRGKYNLTMDADVIYESGGLVEHLNYYDFQYEKF